MLVPDCNVQTLVIKTKTSLRNYRIYKTKSGYNIEGRTSKESMPPSLS